MQKTFRSRTTTTFIATTLVFSMLAMSGFTPTGSAAIVTASLPAGANQNVSRTFQAPRQTPVYVTVRLKNNGSRGVVPAKRLTVKLFRPNGSLAGTKAELVNPGATKNVSFQSADNSAAACGLWKVEVANPNDNATSATASITVDYKFMAQPINNTYSVFGLVQGQTVRRNITIPQSGDVTIKATWDGPFPGVDYKLTFRLKKGNSSTTAASDTGYADQVLNPLISNQKLRLTYKVTQQDIQQYGTNWKLEVVGSTQGNVANVKPRRTLVPNCY